MEYSDYLLQYCQTMYKQSEVLNVLCQNSLISITRNKKHIETSIQILYERVLDMRTILDIAILYGENAATKPIKTMIQKRINLWNSIDTENKMSCIEIIADLCSYGLITDLSDNYSLSKLELLICSYIYLGFTSDQIRYVYNYKNPNHLYNIRHCCPIKIVKSSLKYLKFS